jgi:FAD/FMN-containing dehydrogenase/ferredoxin
MPFTPDLHRLRPEQWRAAMDDVVGGRASPAFAELCRRLSPQAQLITTPAERQIYAHDLAELPSPMARLFSMMPGLVVQPSTPEDVAEVLRWSRAHNLPTTPRGLASSAYSGAVPTQGGLVLDLVRMNAIGELDRETQTIEVQAGVKWGDLDQHLAKYDYEPATYPSSRFSTVGAWAMMGGYGINAFGGGHFSLWIESLKIVLPDGRLIRCDKGTPEFNRFIGTEGQLGVITSLRLRVKPRVTCLPILVYCGSGVNGITLVEAIVKAGVPAQHIKLLDWRQMRSLNRLFREEHPKKAAMYEEQDAVFLTFDAQVELDTFEALLKTLDLPLTLAPRHVALALWHERFFSMKAKRFGPSLLAAQVVMPLARTAGYVEKVAALASRFGLHTETETYVITQPDGSHAALVMPAFTCDARRLSYLLHLALVQIVTRLGIKLGGRPYAAGLWNGAFAREKYGDRYEALRAAKRELDPENLLNPGKFPRVRTRLGPLTDWIFAPMVFRVLMDSLYLAAPLAGAIAQLLDRVGRRAMPAVPKSNRHVPLPLTDAEFEEAIRACTSCGDCLPVCPAYLITADETVVGRTKLRTGLKALHHQPIDRRESDHTFLCMYCSACEDVCQSSLPLVSMYEKIEAKLAEQHGRPDDLIAEFLYQAQTSEAFYPFVGASQYPPPQPEMTLVPAGAVPVAQAEDTFRATVSYEFPDYDDARPVLDPVLIPVNHGAQRAKYHIETATAAPRAPLPSKFRIHRAAHCINCAQCERACVYGVHFRRPDDVRRMAEPDDSQCRNCFRCIQECPKLALTMSLNPEYQAMGRGVFTADVVSSLMKQAESGQIPVLGQGYRGLFSGPGFDSMWTDMSEIVRPTRDGIHGREYISTGVMLGRRPDRLRIDPQTKTVLVASERAMLELPLPVIFGRMPRAVRLPVVTQVIAIAAHHLQTLAEVNVADWHSGLDLYAEAVVLQMAISDVEAAADLIKRVLVVELTGEGEGAITDSSALIEAIEQVRRVNPATLVAVRLPVESTTPGLALELARNPAIDILWVAGEDGVNVSSEAAPNLVAGLPKIHQVLVEVGIRDQITLVASGGLAMAEHCPKSFILGADAVAVDWPLAIALECRVNASCVDDECACNLSALDLDWGRQRIVNLMGAWRLQILEVLGAMGLREICRLRGERGRALFAADLEKQFFAPLMSQHTAGRYGIAP